MRWFGSLKVLVLASVALSFIASCGPKKYNKRPKHRVDDDDTTEPAPKAKPADETRQGVAGPNAWLSLDQFGGKVHVPQGWNWAQQGVAIVANAPKATGSLAFIGATNDDDMGVKLKKAVDVLKINTGTADSEPRKIQINGLNFVRLDYSHATVEGSPAHALALVGGAPGHKGQYVIFVGYALSGNEDTEEELRDSVNSIASN
jgi:hypothetical protein